MSRPADHRPSERFVHEAVEDWERLPSGWSHRDVSDVAVDSRDRVYVLTRGEHPVIVYERDGTFVGSWGEGMFDSPHGITVGPDDAVYCVDNGDHTVRKFTNDGTLSLVVGTVGSPSDTGYDGHNMSVRRSAPPFHRPTKVCALSSGDFYVSDGYGNARIHRFSATGELQQSWGEPGEGPGQFRLPHGIAANRDETRLLVCDRENDRVQVFGLSGDFLAEWTDLARPSAVALTRDGYAYVTELGRRAEPGRGAEPSRCSVFGPDGRLVARWGDEGDPWAPGSLFAAHGIALDSHDDVYVAEITWSAGGRDGDVPETCHTLQKLTRTAHTPAPGRAGEVTKWPVRDGDGPGPGCSADGA